jgi:hypothetical protein
MEELKALEEKFSQTEDFLESMELLSQIDDLKLRLGIIEATVCSVDNPDCISCGS